MLDRIPDPGGLRFAFGPFILSPGERLLLRGDEPVEIGGRAFALLQALVEAPGRVISKRELMLQAWPDVQVEDGSLRFHMAGLRKALQDGVDGARYIDTQIGAGYALVVLVRRIVGDATSRRPVEAVAWREDLTDAGRLPARLTRLIGREEEKRLLADRIVDAKLVTIVGAAGIGKTTLAVELAHTLLPAFANRVYFVDLAALESGDLPLRAWGEQVHWLGPLDFPDDPSGLSAETLLSFSAIELFVTRARAANGSMAVNVDSLRRIARLCRRLEGMALSIELTAMHAARHGLDSTAELLGERFSLGWTGRRTVRARQQTLQVTLDWSYDLLGEAERRTLESVSVFVGSFSLQAAFSVIADTSLSTERAAAALDELIAKSLVAFDQEGGPNPIRLPEMTRAYARGKLLARSEETVRAVARRHAEYFLALLEEVATGEHTLHGGGARIDGQIGNIRTALAAAFGPEGDGTLAVRLAAATIPVFLNMSLLVECRTWCARASSVLDAEQTSAAIELELQAALGLSLMFTRGNVEAVGIELLRAYHLAVDLNDHRAQLRMLVRLHIYHERIGDFAVARDWACKALDAASVIDEPEAHSVAAALFGISCHLAGDQGEAQAYLESAVRDALPSQRLRTIHYGFDHRNRSLIALSRAGRHTKAIEVIDNTIERCVANGEYIYTPNLLRIKAEALMHADGNNRQAAGRLLEDALAWARKQRARAWELRAALAFVRLEREAAGSARALEILRSLRESFDEGLDTADLRAAEALLAGSPELIAGE